MSDVKFQSTERRRGYHRLSHPRGGALHFRALRTWKYRADRRDARAVEYDIPVVWVVWNHYAYASIRGLQRGYLGSRELATDFHHPKTGEPYNPDFAAMARSAGVEGVSIDKPADLGDAIGAGIASGKPYLIDANIAGDLNPPGAGVWELPGIGVNSPAIGERYEPGS